MSASSTSLKKKKQVLVKRRKLSRKSVDSDEDDDETPPTEERLTWRNNKDANENLSDWTIQIVAEDQETSYHVHKCVLAVGTRRSGYFARLFQSNLSESSTSSVKLQLEPLAAAAFPVVLDFLYFESDPLQIKTENSTALFFLGQYLDIASLRYEAKNFWKSDLNVQNSAVYYEHAQVFRDEKIMETVARRCATGLAGIPVNSPLLEVSDPNLWRSIIEFGNLEGRKSLHEHLSRLLAKSLTQYERLDQRTFLELTDKSVLPYLHPTAVEELLALHTRLVGCDNDDDDDELTTCLHDRCIEALYKSWPTINVAGSVYAQQSPAFLQKLLLACLSSAKSENEQLKASLAEERRRRHSLPRYLVDSSSESDDALLRSDEVFSSDED